MDKIKKDEFSKFLLKQESLLIWIMSISFIILAFYCIAQGFTGSLPWLSAMVGFPWSAYGISQTFYYTKSKAENTCGGIKYEAMLKEIQQMKVECQSSATQDSGIDSASTTPIENTDDY